MKYRNSKSANIFKEEVRTREDELTKRCKNSLSVDNCTAYADIQVLDQLKLFFYLRILLAVISKANSASTHRSERRKGNEIKFIRCGVPWLRVL